MAVQRLFPHDFKDLFHSRFIQRWFAAAMEGQIPLAVKTARMNELVELTNTISAARNQTQCGVAYEVMVEGPSERDPSKYAGRVRNNKAMVFTVPDGVVPRRGELVQVLAEAAHLWGFSGKMVAD